jgi:hypothetical protein
VSFGRGAVPEDISLDALGKTRTPNAIASIFHAQMRIDIIPKDSKQYLLNPLKLSIALTAKGIAKFQEMNRTGRPQEFDSKEFSSFQTDLEFGFPKSKAGTGKLLMKPIDLAARMVPVRMTFGSGANFQILPYLESRVERHGTEEVSIVAETRDKSFSLRMSIILGDRAGGETDINMKLEGAGIHAVQKYLRAILALQQSGEVEMSSLETDSVILKAKCALDGPTEQDLWYLNLVDDVVRIADHLGLSIKWPKKISEKDIELLLLLKAAIDGKPIGSGIQCTGQAVKSSESLAKFDALKPGGELALVPDVPRDFFGTRIEPRTFAISARGAHIKDFDATRRQLEAAASGETVEVVYESREALIVRLWDKVHNCPK